MVERTFRQRLANVEQAVRDLAWFLEKDPHDYEVQETIAKVLDTKEGDIYPQCPVCAERK